MFQMSIRASRATRLLVAVGVAWLGLALSAQAAHATYGKVQIAKINQGGDRTTLHVRHQPDAVAEPGDFTLKGGQASSAFSVECNARHGVHVAVGQPRCHHRAPGAGYTLTDDHVPLHAGHLG